MDPGAFAVLERGACAPGGGSVSNPTVIEAENERYAAVLVFVHGLWARPEIWRSAAHGFAHRGWRCAVLESDRSIAGRAPFSSWCAEVGGEIENLGRPAVVIGHDAGGLVALALAGNPGVCASVAVAPLLSGPGGLVGPGARLRSRLGLGDVAPPRAGAPYCQVVGRAESAMLDGFLVAESARRVGSLRGRAITPGASPSPCLLVGQESDAVVPASLVEVVAAGIEADFLKLSGGHWPMLEPQLDSWMSTLHRWLVRRLGPNLLLFDGHEDLVDE